MEISYDKLWRHGKNENVSTDVLVRICAALKYDVADIMELQPVNEMPNK